ncbi:MAG: LysR family transcriptional regulator [Clostridiales bacterium]|nr:LysR family transcriptional regulator [Clostridiales bacterium]
MDISYFHEFVILAETKNFWEASERLYISQSALSKHIKNMEIRLGTPLFSRTSRKVELTEFGRRMLPYAQSIARLEYGYETEAFNFTHQKYASLNFGTIPDMAHFHITDALLRFKLAYPNIPIDIQEADTLILRKMLLERKCELAFLRDSRSYFEKDPDEELLMEKVPYIQDDIVAVLPADHPLCESECVELKQLSGERFAMLHQNTLPYDLCMCACREVGFIPDIVFTSHNLESILDMVRIGGCVALLFRNHVSFPYSVDLVDHPPFVPVSLTPLIETTVCLAYRKNDRLSPAAEYFIEYYRQVCEECGTASE